MIREEGLDKLLFELEIYINLGLVIDLYQIKVVVD